MRLKGKETVYNSGGLKGVDSGLLLQTNVCENCSDEEQSSHSYLLVLGNLAELHASNVRTCTWRSLKGPVVIRPRPFVQRKYSGWKRAYKLGTTLFVVALLLFYSRTSDTSMSTQTVSSSDS